MVGILALPDDEGRLYECEGGCLGLSLSERGRQRNGAVAARGKELVQERWAAWVSCEEAKNNNMFLLKPISIVFTSIYIPLSQIIINTL